MSDDEDWPDEAADDTALVLIPRFIAAASGPFWFSTVGQPLRGTIRRDALAWLGALGFPHVASGPYVRSSYHADEMIHA